jgi:D-beta-D-heptose 7-phosphate kinase/D-beta-D-heptose 1-phosphate adenosyltransferase
MDDLLESLANWPPPHDAPTVAVVGDVMLDELVFGDAERLTADAPVPVLAVKRTERIPGGAANVCLDLVALGVRVAVFATVGDDPEGHFLRRSLEDAGVDTAGLITDTARPTTVKRSLVGLAQHRHPQKMFRLDIENTAPIDDATKNQLLERLRNTDPAVIAIEDYNKGLLKSGLATDAIALASERGIPSVVDPASIPDFSRYAGATLITPNRTEAERATSNSSHDPAALAAELRRAVPCGTVVLTLDKDGALLLEPDAEPLAIPTVAREVYDVTGAGDMVLAALAAALANRLTTAHAVRFANAAAGLEVEVFGVKPIPFERVYQSILTNSGSILGKQRSIAQARIEIAAARAENKRVVFTNGCFDIIHAGHIHILKAAKQLGDILVLGLNDDRSVRRLKGPDRPVHDERDRVAVLSELESVDIITLFSEDTPIELLKELKPDILAKGADYQHDTVVGAELVESWGGTVQLIPLLEGRSTTAAIERIRAS